MGGSQGDVERAGRGRRAQVKRSAHAVFRPAPDRDPLAILVDQNESRLPDLVPVRMGRMLQSPFAFYRGGAAVMAADLSPEPRTGIDVVICGDAHIANFGMYASPERNLVLDLNDFDESTYGPWEWDVKRLAASVEVGARENGLSAEARADAVAAAVRSYRDRMEGLFELSALERYYRMVSADEVEQLAAPDTRRVLEQSARKARRRTSERLMERLTVESVDGEPRIADQWPVIRHTDESTEEELEAVVRAYQRTVREDVAVLLSQFEATDRVLRIVGVGSVGTRCYIVLLVGPDGEPLFLQAKEAGVSVLRRYGDIPAALPQGVRELPRVGLYGYRVVAAQRVLQAVSDPFLGWVEFAGRDYYVRQFRDMKGSIETEGLGAGAFTQYVTLCGGLLARAHSQSPGSAAIAGYMGTSDTFVDAISDWARAYADQNERDHEALRAAVKAGKIEAEEGV